MIGNAGLSFIFRQAKKNDVVVLAHIGKEDNGEDRYSMTIDNVTVKGTELYLGREIQRRIDRERILENLENREKGE